jgi:hypothetical protein
MQNWERNFLQEYTPDFTILISEDTLSTLNDSILNKPNETKSVHDLLKNSLPFLDTILNGISEIQIREAFSLAKGSSPVSIPCRYGQFKLQSI